MFKKITDEKYDFTKSIFFEINQMSCLKKVNYIFSVQVETHGVTKVEFLYQLEKAKAIS